MKNDFEEKETRRKFFEKTLACVTSVISLENNKIPGNAG